MRITPATLCLLALLMGCDRGGDGESGASLDRSAADTTTTATAAGDTAGSGALSWGPPPPALPAGVRLAVVDGDPGKPGPFTLRLDMPAGYEVRPHTHPTSEEVRVVEGAVMVGMGKKWDDAALKSLATGQEVSLGAKEPHFVRARERAMVEVRSTGPFVINYVNPADDPRKAQ